LIDSAFAITLIVVLLINPLIDLLIVLHPCFPSVTIIGLDRIEVILNPIAVIVCLLIAVIIAIANLLIHSVVVAPPTMNWFLAKENLLIRP
jgi:hypothetical protein